MRTLLLIPFIFITSCYTSDKQMKYNTIAEKIIELSNNDLALRSELAKKGKLNEGYNEEMEELHNRNAEILNRIIEKIGYPTIDKVGKQANEATWLIIQHSIGQPIFMKKCKKLLAKAVSEERANPINLAYLTDRIATFEGRPQRYGTQFDWDENGILNPQLFDDLIKVNQRRKAIGLNTIEEQTEILRRQTKRENQSPPKDFEEKRLRFEKWRKEVGWVK